MNPSMAVYAISPRQRRNGKSNKAIVISTSSDRKESVIFVDFNFQRVIAVN